MSFFLITGPKGQIGPRGSQGPNGPRGLKGNHGTTGLKGTQLFAFSATYLFWQFSILCNLVNIYDDHNFTGDIGAPGNRGPSGPKGQKGSQGSTGTKGQKGARGSPGAQGQKGISAGNHCLLSKIAMIDAITKYHRVYEMPNEAKKTTSTAFA